jgi:hypothetical protein
LKEHVLAALVSLAGLQLPATNLDGEARVFPKDADAPRSVFVVTFTKAASEAGAAWTLRLREIQSRLSASIFQVAVLEEVPRLFRSMVTSALAKQVPPALRSHFWIVTSASDGWQQCTSSAADDQPHVFVIDDRERIVWQAAGAVSDAKLRELVELPPSSRDALSSAGAPLVDRRRLRSPVLGGASFANCGGIRCGN